MGKGALRENQASSNQKRVGSRRKSPTRGRKPSRNYSLQDSADSESVEGGIGIQKKRHFPRESNTQRRQGGRGENAVQ